MSRNSRPTPPIGVLERGVAILKSFDDQALRLSLNDLAARTGLDKATLLRLTGVLVGARLLHRLENGTYTLGSVLLQMGMLYRRTFDLGARIQPALHDVVQETGETAALYIRSGDYRICLYRENTTKEVRHHVEVGTCLPLKVGGSSAHVLEFFTGGSTPHAKLIREMGYAMTRSERVAEMASVALPVFDADGGFIGALVVLGLASRCDEKAQLKAVDVVRHALALRGFRTQPPGDDHI